MIFVTKTELQYSPHFRCSPVVASVASDRAALLAVYAAWGNQPAVWTAGIASGASHCTWAPWQASDYGTGFTDVGIVCDASGFVTQIHATTQKIVGTIPPQFARLTKLQILNVADNALYGTIPVELTSLSSLTELCAALPSAFCSCRTNIAV